MVRRPGLALGALLFAAFPWNGRAAPPESRPGSALEAALEAAARKVTGGDPSGALADLAPWVRRSDGHSAALFQLIGRAHEARGSPLEAARAYRTAGFLAPEAEPPRSALRRLSASRWTGTSQLLGRLGRLDEAIRRTVSLTWIGAAREALEVLGERRDRVARASRANALGELGRFEEAEEELVRIEAEAPRQPLVPYLRASFAHWQGDTDAEASHLAEAARRAPGDPDVEAAEAARFAASGETDRVRAFLVRDQSRPGAEEPQRRLGRAALRVAIGEGEAARQDLAILGRDFLPSPQVLVVEAGLELRSGRIEEGVRALRRMIELAEGNVLLLPAANLLASVGRPELGRRALEGLSPPQRHDPRVLALFHRLSGGQEGSGQGGTRGPLRWRASATMPEAAVERALALLGAARTEVDARLGRPGPDPVDLHLVHVPGESPWGYYDAVTRRIVYRGDFSAGTDPLSDPLVRHVARHEYAHMAFDALLRGTGEPVVAFPRWMMEGVADRLAGGVEYLGRFGYDPERLAAEPGLDLDRLARILATPILGSGSIPQEDQARAYVVGHRLVGILLERLARPGEPEAEAWVRLAELARSLGRGGDLEAGLMAHVGLGLAELERLATGQGEAR